MSRGIESQFEFCRYELKGGEGKEYKDKGYSGKRDGIIGYHKNTFRLIWDA